jgi:glycosyltransferase involved in cell wall biosynthesis
MANGLPFVATRVGNIAREAAAMDLGWFVPPSDPRAFAGALDDLLDLEAKERARRGAASMERAGELWDIRNRMPSWYRVYDLALERSRSRD